MSQELNLLLSDLINGTDKLTGHINAQLSLSGVNSGLLWIVTAKRGNYVMVSPL